MRFLSLAFATTTLLSGAAAFADAPGDYYGNGDDGAGPGGQAMGPSSYEPTAPPAVSRCGVRGQRWSIGFGIGSASLAPKGADPGSESKFSIGELSLHYRVTQHLELGLDLAAGKEALPDGQMGDRQLNSGAIDLRYRFDPNAQWNWWVMGGLGKAGISYQGATQDEQKAAMQKSGQLGVGIERHFERFALQAELRWITMGGDHGDHGGGKAVPSSPPPPDNGGGYMPTPDGGGVSTDPGTGKVPPPPNSTGSAPPSTKLEGGQFTIGLSYYF